MDLKFRPNVLIFRDVPQGSELEMDNLQTAQRIKQYNMKERVSFYHTFVDGLMKAMKDADVFTIPFQEIRFSYTALVNLNASERNHGLRDISLRADEAIHFEHQHKYFDRPMEGIAPDHVHLRDLTGMFKLYTGRRVTTPQEIGQLDKGAIDCLVYDIMRQIDLHK